MTIAEAAQLLQKALHSATVIFWGVIKRGTGQKEREREIVVVVVVVVAAAAAAAAAAVVYCECDKCSLQSQAER